MKKTREQIMAKANLSLVALQGTTRRQLEAADFSFENSFENLGIGKVI